MTQKIENLWNYNGKAKENVFQKTKDCYLTCVLNHLHAAIFPNGAICVMWPNYPRAGFVHLPVGYKGGVDSVTIFTRECASPQLNTTPELVLAMYH